MCETGRKERYKMEQTEKINKLFENTKIVMHQYEQDRKKQGMDFNVFEILDIKEVMTCRMLHALLDPKGAHGCGGLFLKLFLQEVLDQGKFSDQEINNAVVIKEKSIPEKSITDTPLSSIKRIDLYICVGKRAFPIEVKLHAPDSECQCYDYYMYAQDTDPNTIIYYLTLDRHEPSDESRKELAIEKELRLISFEREIRDWLKECLKQEEVQRCIAIKTIIEQFLDNINRLTGREGEELAMKIITDFETFKTANMIAESVRIRKTDMMRDVFLGIEEELGKYTSYPDYKDRVDKYYTQSKSTYPSLNYYLNEEKSLVMRIEVDWNLYFGICRWDKENKCVLQKLESDIEAMNEKIKEYMLEKYMPNETETFYRWGYLPADNPINFKTFDGSYSALFDKDEYMNIINKICDTLKRVLDAMKEELNWKKDNG